MQQQGQPPQPCPAQPMDPGPLLPQPIMIPEAGVAPVSRMFPAPDWVGQVLHAETPD